MRAEFEVENSCPKVESPTLSSGTETVGVLKALKNSERNSSLLDSVIGKTRKKERSKLRGQSDRKAFRPVLPNVYGAGFTKAAGLSRCDAPCWPQRVRRLGLD